MVSVFGHECLKAQQRLEARLAMNSKLLTAFLVVAALMQGCIINQNGGGGGGGTPPPTHTPVAGDVTMTWSFVGLTCADVPQVKEVQINIPGETLQNAGVYPCLVANYPGVVLHNFAPGNYTFTIDAYGYANEHLFAGSGSFTVDGNIRTNIDLTPVGGPTSYALLTWTFPPSSIATNPTCAQAGQSGISTVDVTIDGVTTQNVDCNAGQSSSGWSTPYLNAGTHSIQIVARDQYGYAYYRYSGSLQTFSGAPVSSNYALQWSVGGTAVKWSITDNSVAQTCGQAGINTVYVNFQDAQGNWIYGNTGDPQPCNSTGVVYNYLQAGTYRLYISAHGSGTSGYESNTSNPPVVTVTAGQFLADSSGAVNVQMFRYQ